MRNDFKEKKAISLDSLLLDEHNPRLGYAKDQEACLEKMIALGQPFFNLAKDIAETGLTIEPIVVLKQGTKYVVKDGNRRISALKLLNRPHISPEKAVQERFVRLADLAEQNFNLVAKVDCYVSSDVDAINAYVWRAHTGENGGIGRKGWESLQQEYYQLSIGEKGSYWRAAKLMLWADQNDIDVPEKFSITTLGRFFNAAKNIKLLGFKFDDEEEIAPIVPKLYAISVVKKIISDISAGLVHVKRADTPGSLSMMNADNRDLYIEAVREEAGLASLADSAVDSPLGAAAVVNPSAQDSGSEVGVGHRPATSGVGASGGDAGQSSPASGVKAGSIPVKHSANRAKYVTKGGHPLTLPKSEQKLRDIYKELTILDKCPVAGMMLVRAFVEGSFKAYVKKFALIKESSLDSATIKELLRLIKNKLLKDGAIAEGGDYAHKIEDLFQDALISVPSMQKYIHSEIFNPRDEKVKNTWDDFYHILKMLWDQIEEGS